MIPTTFKQSNVVYAKDQPEYLPLPAHKTTDGQVTSCWKMGIKDRLRVLLSGRVFVTMLTFNQPLQPLRVSAKFNL